MPRRGLEFSAPKLVEGEPEVIWGDDVEDELEQWKASLILFAVGKDLSMNAMKQFVEKV